MRQPKGFWILIAAMLQRQGQTEAGLREQVRRGRRADKLIAQVVGPVPAPTEDEMRAHFAAHQDEYARAERAQAQHILVKPTGSDEVARKAAQTKLEEIRARVKAGAAFADEAAAHSECPSGRQAGGSLGWFSRGMMVPAFDQAVFSMAVGELSGLVETPFGFHLIQKTGHEQAAAADYDEARENIRDFLRHAARGAALSAHVAELRARAKVVIA